MTAINSIREIAEAAAQRYNNAILSFKGAYDSALDRPDVFSQRAVEILSNDLYHVGEVYMRTETVLIENEVRETLLNARRDARSDLRIDIAEKETSLSDAHLSAIQEHIRLEIATQLERDIQFVIKRYRQLALRVEIHRNATGWQYGASLTQVKMQEKALKHYFRDRAGRKIPSQRFVRMLWRQELIHGYMRAYILEMSAFGVKELKIWHPNQDHRAYGQIVSLVEDGQSFEDIKDDVFHPNTEALLKPI